MRWECKRLYLYLLQPGEIQTQALFAVFALELHIDKFGAGLHFAFKNDALAEDGVPLSLTGVEALLLRWHRFGGLSIEPVAAAAGRGGQPGRAGRGWRPVWRVIRRATTEDLASIASAIVVLVEVVLPVVAVAACSGCCATLAASAPAIAHQFTGQVVQEARGLCSLCLTEDGAAGCAHQVEAVHGARKTDVSQAAFLLEFLLLAGGTRVGQRPLVHAYDEDDGIFQSLRGVQRNQRYSITNLFVRQRA